jgi:hypothetical protein
MITSTTSTEWQGFLSEFPAEAQRILLKVKPLFVEDNILYWHSELSDQEKQFLTTYKAIVNPSLSKYFGVSTAKNVKVDEVAISFIQKAYEHGFSNVKVELR